MEFQMSFALIRLDNDLEMYQYIQFSKNSTCLQIMRNCGVFGRKIMAMPCMTAATALKPNMYLQ
jgi:hypothetical protein